MQNEKDELKAAGWKAEGAAADVGGGLAGAPGMPALASQNAAAGLEKVGAVVCSRACAGLCRDAGTRGCWGGERKSYVRVD